LARIALDAMGGDHAPRAPIAGALRALAELPPQHHIELVGRSAVVSAELEAQLAGDHAEFAVHRDRLSIVEAADVIEMSDKPTVALRGKQQSSMVIGLRRVLEGQADAFVSAGNTGAQMAASTVLFKLHAGLTRPAIGAMVPTARQPVVILDAGANVDCTSEELVQFARIGDVYARHLLGRTSPGIGLLSIGEEAEKGNAAVKEAHQLLRKADLNFIGNVEGRDIPNGACDGHALDVVICDGFVGNVLLKFYESAAPFLIGVVTKSVGLDTAQVTKSLKQLDVDEYGGAPLLGVRGVSIISHGSSSPRALKNAIRMAVTAVESGMNEEMGRRLSAPNGNVA
jgi:glycerol-3-phosphate acyltransferase PlsX